MSKANPHYIDKTKAPPPKYVRHEHPPLFKSGKPNPYGQTFKTQVEEDAYWDEEFRRCLEGYYVSDHKTEENRLTGEHYFYLQNGVLRAATQYKHPIWRDWDDYLFKAWEKARKEGRDFLVVKKRGIGLSSVFAGAIPAYNCLFSQTSDNGMTSADKERVKDVFENKAKVFISRLHPYIRLGIETVKQEMIHFSDQYSEQASEAAKNIQEKKKAIEEKFYVDPERASEEGLEDIIDSRIICKPTSKDPRAFETFRFVYAFIDEIGLHPFADKVRSSLIGCVEEDSRRIGSIAMGGTIEEMTRDGAASMEKMWWSKTANIDRFFIPGYACMEGFMVNGHSYEKEAKEHILKQREEYKNSDNELDREEYYNYIKRHPITIDEVFDAVNGDFWNENVTNILKEQSTYVKSANIVTQPGKLRNDQETIKFEPDRQKGKIEIFERPKPGIKNLYVAGIDPISYVGGDAGSNCACVVLKRTLDGSDYNNLPVAIYEDRGDIDVMSNNLINLLRYYNNAPTLIEQQYMEAIKDEFSNYNWIENGQQKNAETELLMPRVRTLGIKYAQNTRSVGQWVNGSVADRFNERAGYFIENYGRNIYFTKLLDAIKNKTDEHTPDLFSALRLAVAEFYEMKNIEVKNSTQNYVEMKFTVTEPDNRGIPRRKTKTIKKKLNHA